MIPLPHEPGGSVVPQVLVWVLGALIETPMSYNSKVGCEFSAVALKITVLILPVLGDGFSPGIPLPPLIRWRLGSTSPTSGVKGVRFNLMIG